MTADPDIIVVTARPGDPVPECQRCGSHAWVLVSFGAKFEREAEEQTTGFAEWVCATSGCGQQIRAHIKE